MHRTETPNANNTEGFLSRAKKNHWLCSSLVWSVVPIIFPQMSLLHIAGWTLFFIAVNITPSYIYNSSKTETDTEIDQSEKTISSAWDFINHLTYKTKQRPFALGILCCLCLLNTLSPFAAQLNLKVVEALSGSSEYQIKTAIYTFAAYRVGKYIFKDLFAKNLSIQFGVAQGITTIEIFKKIYDKRSESQETNMNDKAAQIKDASKMTSDFWYYWQTIFGAIISMLSSLFGVINFSVPAAYTVAKNLLLVRCAFIAIFLQALTLNINTLWGDDASSEVNTKKQDVANSFSSTVGNWDEIIKNLKKALYKELFLIKPVTDFLYNFPKQQLEDNNLVYILLLLTAGITFPLTTITVAQVISLASSIKSMISDFSAISRNAGNQVSYNSKFHSYLNDVLTKTELYEAIDDMPAKIECTNQSYLINIIDTTILLACLFVALPLLGLTTTGMVISTPTASLTLCAAILYLCYAVRKANEAPENQQSARPEQKSSLRFQNFCCNISTSLLFTRLVGIFLPNAPDITVNFLAKMIQAILPQKILLTFEAINGITLVTAYPPIFVFGVITSITMTCFITPFLVERKDSLNPIEVIKSIADLIKPMIFYPFHIGNSFINAVKSSEFKNSNNSSQEETSGKRKTGSNYFFNAIYNIYNFLGLRVAR